MFKLAKLSNFVFELTRLFQFQKGKVCKWLL